MGRRLMLVSEELRLMRLPAHKGSAGVQLGLGGRLWLASEVQAPPTMPHLTAWFPGQIPRLLLVGASSQPANANTH